MRLGIISDTHGLLRPEAVRALAGVDVIIHAGDVGRANILADLAAIAPVHAVRGNVDVGDWAEALPEETVVEVAGRRLFVLHDVARLRGHPAAEGCDAVVFGHSHRVLVEDRDAILYLNPGSAGPRRFSLPVTLATLEIGPGSLVPEIVALV
jgi:hypothetical protein